MLANVFPLALLALAAGADATSVGFGKVGETVQCLRALTQRSCHSKYTIPYDSPATCCYNGALGPDLPESGLFLSTQFWDTNPATGRPDATTAHGEWPDFCDGTYPAYCSNVTGIPEYTGAEIRAVLQKYSPETLAFMDVNYKGYNGTDEDFWEHEYNKHGTCITTNRPECQIPLPGISREDFVVLEYFKQIVRRFKALPTYDWLAEAGIVPSTNTTYSLKSIQDALAKKHGGIPYIGCRKGELNEFWYFDTVKGQLSSPLAHFYPENSTTKSNCPEQVKYLPKVF
ncbi:uncharacterized protein PFL1_01209 [Pseudozyma flocculosa PF-1]|uniref:ribonuclease T2 n=1 Tax=Pseudozyma flocculosa TaxID=84751 RepID=A0A5C3EVH6_9BASI|nr:uncharacterized protein PFL1_01209 [Pseudozyma flocculosa PF-1]EPQ31020.1 hypothetical protein PFL1_01209 [Pseudozyma flocculosa PF-1]SPO35860.1 related to Ribonuclease Trv [Pseudozyma flocculosa]